MKAIFSRTTQSLSEHFFRAMGKPRLDDRQFNKYKEQYMPIFMKLFLPENPSKYDIVNYFSSLLRVTGAEDHGWDPYAESKGLLNDINGIFKLKLPVKYFPSPDLTTWRLGLFMYSHIVEMNAPYEVLANLLRFQIGDGYSPNPFYKYLTEKQKKQKRDLYPNEKIKVIKEIDKKLNSGIGEVFDDFYNNKLRNAVNHSNFVITDSHFRVRKSLPQDSFSIKLEELDKTLTKAKAFIASFFEAEFVARLHWGENFGGKGLPYDPDYKGMMEVLVDAENLLSGFKVHWPNSSESFYMRSEKGARMVNCWVMPEKGRLELYVDLYARDRSKFSPLVEKGSEPQYSNLANGKSLTWPETY